MKKYLLFLLVVIIGIFIIPNDCFAAGETGYRIEYAIPMKSGVELTKTWDKNDDSLDCYNKIDIPSKGYIHFYMTKPYANGKLGTVEIILQKLDGATLVDKTFYNDKKTYIEFYSPVDKGTYYVNFDTHFYIVSGTATSKYHYDFVPLDNIESEMNSSIDSAMEISRNKMYTGISNLESDDSYYKVSLKANKKARIYISNYYEFTKDGYIYLSSDFSSEEGIYEWKVSKDNARQQYYYEFVPKESGYYYLNFRNYGSTEDNKQIFYTLGVYQNKTTNSNPIKEVQKIAKNATADKIPVYRMYNPTSGEHLYTTDAHEVEVIYKEQGWGYEGIAWYSSNKGTKVYRLYNPKLGNHLYTSDMNEIRIITKTQGWKYDFGGSPVMYSNGNVSVYRLYNQPLNGMHHLTTDSNEYKVLPRQNWAQEGVSMNALEIGVPTATDYYNVSF